MPLRFPRYWAGVASLAAVFAATGSLGGNPAVVVRAGTSPEGLPIGVQVVARNWRDYAALAGATWIERQLGGWQPASLGA